MEEELKEGELLSLGPQGEQRSVQGRREKVSAAGEGVPSFQALGVGEVRRSSETLKDSPGTTAQSLAHARPSHLLHDEGW